MRENADVDKEIRDLFGQREGTKQQTKNEVRQPDVRRSSYSGSTTMLVVILCLVIALAAWPFAKTLIPAPQQSSASLYYKVPADAGIIPASFEEESIDIFFFTGCAHQRRVQPKLQLTAKQPTGEV